MDEGVLFRNYSTAKRIRADFAATPLELDSVCGVWIWGLPDAGKSHKARKDYPKFFDKMINKWWDGWDPSIHDTVLLDDFDTCHRALGHYLKRWTDKYPFSGEIKNLVVQVRPKWVVVTSNYTIQDIFGDDATLCAALERRFNIVHLNERWQDRVAREAAELLINPLELYS